MITESAFLRAATYDYKTKFLNLLAQPYILTSAKLHVYVII